MNRKGFVDGTQDTLLNRQGVYQAVALAQALQRIRFDYAVTSDLPRAFLVSLPKFSNTVCR